MSNKDIIAKIKASAYENVNKKLEEERKKTEDKINNELTQVETCLKYIGNKMVFKIIKSSRTTDGEYTLADENTFFEDYNKEPEYSFNRGIKFYNSKSKPYEPLFVVNGEAYYDIRYIIRNYEERFNEYARRLNNLRENYDTVKEMADKLIKQEPQIKKLIEQYKQVDIDESFLEELHDNEW